MAESDEQEFVLNPELIAAAVKLLRQTKIHPNFAGYLCLKKAYAKNGGEAPAHANFLQFFDDHLRPSDGTSEKPYLRPFKENGDPASDIWTNPNVAGSYAPSSIRHNSPFRNVVSIEGSGTNAKYSLKDNHATQTRKHLLFGAQISAPALATFLYRDYGFTGVNPTIDELVNKLFRVDFGFAIDTEFNEVFNLQFPEQATIAPHFIPWKPEIADAEK